MVTSNLPPGRSNATDFSRPIIEARIQAGYNDALGQGIGDVDAPGLRFGVTASDIEQGASRFGRLATSSTTTRAF